MLEMLTIEPPPAAAIRAPATAISRNGPLRLTSMVLSKSPSETSSRLGERGAMPALLTRTSSRPRSAYTLSTAGSMLAHWPTCRASGTAATPVALVIASAAASQASALRLETTTVAPASASPRAIA